MIALGIAVAAVAAFILSSIYYIVTTPIEKRALGDRLIDRGKPAVWKVVTELLRTAVVGAAFAWVAAQAGMLTLPGAVLLAVVLWIAFPLVLLTGSIIWERVPWQTAAIHAGDWLLKLLLVALVLGLIH
ncbi:DUF1761 domain-containing protein [Microbacterium aurantiacum]|uniref:DUF1761 domain-containing protein n=1 Tax=Microbacterium aurantiacum TaxID=162393 RepID=UPI000C809779|nr:DUF1761 domain-containing protein [Microbacterium aurantiacum]